MNLIMLTAALALGAPPVVPAGPIPVRDVLHAQRFTLDNGYTFNWRQDRPTVAGGYLVVFEVNPDCVYPRQTAEPVLFVDQTTAERLNVGYSAGRVVAIVPDRVGPGGEPVPQDLSKAWFGTPGLPLDISVQTIADERARADQAGVAPLADAKVGHARAAGGEALRLTDKRQLLGAAARLMKQYTPDEISLIESYEKSATLK